MPTAPAALAALLLAPLLLAQAAPDRPTAAELLPLEERSATFRFLEGAANGDTAQLTKTPGDEPGEWVITMQGRNRLYARQSPDGEIVASRLDLLDKNYAIVYDEPIPLLPAPIRPGRTTSMRTHATVYDLETGQEQYSGPVTHQIESVSRARFDTPAGRKVGYLIELHHVVNLDLASVTLELETGYVAGTGAVYRRIKSSVEKLGMFGDTDTSTAVLAEEGPTP